MPRLPLIREVEVCAARAWPAAETERLDGWQLRHTAGVTRRANSVWANADEGGLRLDEKLARVEQFYADRNLPARFQLCPASQPPVLDAVLAAHGYREDASTAVQIGTVSRVLKCAAPLQSASLTIEERLAEEWFSVYTAVETVHTAGAPALRGILERIPAPTGFAHVRMEGVKDQTVGVGLGVVDSGWLGLFCMGTLPEFRRRGAATAILHALAAWGGEHGSGRVYLQVMDGNGPAMGVYARAGFETLYHYHYRERVRSCRQ